VKVWTIKGFEGHWPVGTAAVVVAETAADAARELNRELQAIGLSGNVQPHELRALDTTSPGAVVLCDGDY
jgi:hypothetical protein